MIGRPRIDVDDTSSTQDEARRRVDADLLPHGALIVARTQRAGRGRAGRAWTTLDDALAFTLVLRPTVAPTRAPRTTLLVGVAVVEALRARGVDVRIKWPNDVVVAADVPGPLGPLRKVAGVLVESTWKGAAVDAVLVGVGVNVRRPAGGVPAELALLATTLQDLGYGGDKEEVLTGILARIDARLPALVDEAAWGDVLAAHRGRSATLGRRVEVRDGDVVRTGEAVDVDDEGALVLVEADGRRWTVRAGDVVPV